MQVVTHDVKKTYGLPDEVRFCKKCVVSNQRPRIEFDDEGVCNACRNAEKKKDIDWQAREQELLDLLSKYRRSDGRFDVLVPSSGGKDSVYVAHLLKYKYKMNPLTATWSPTLYTQVGWRNFQRLIKAGLPNILGSADGKVNRRLVRDSLIHLGEPFQPFDYGQVSFPIQIAVKYDIPLVMDGENAEIEYGGKSTSDAKSFNIDDELKYWLLNCPVDYWLDHGYTKNELIYYKPPPMKDIEKAKINRQFFSYYTDWDPAIHTDYAKKWTSIESHPEGRSEGTYTADASLDDKIDGFHYWLMYMKFGICRATADAAVAIRNGHITREQGVKYVREYDHEFPSRHFDEFLDYCRLSRKEFFLICDSWRGEHIWTRTLNGWKLLQGKVK